MKFEVKSAEAITAMSENEKAEYLVAKNANDLELAQKEYNEKLEGKASKEDLELALKEVGKLKDARTEALEASMKAMGEEMAKVMESAKKQSKGMPKGFKGALMAQLHEKKDSIAKLAKEKSGTLELEIKAEQVAGDIDSGTDFAQMEAGVGQIATRQPFMRELFNNQSANSEYIKYNDQETIVRDAKNVAGCAASTHNSKVTWKVRTLQITKVRDFVDVCVDMMEDYDFVQGEITNLVNTDVKLKVDSQLLLSDGVYPNTNSVSNVASTFAPGDYTAAIASPTLADLIKITGAQISDAGQNNKFVANYAIVNPVDACKMQLEKDANGNYLLPAWVTSDGVNVGAIRIIQNQLVPADEMYVGDFSKGTVFSRKGITVEMSFENNNNFERELVTVKAYERLNLRVRNVDANAFLYVPSIAAALTAITKP